MKNKEQKRDHLQAIYSLLDLIRLVCIVTLVFLVLTTFVMRKEEVIGTSMYPTLEEGDDVLINVAASYLTDINRFDVVVAKNSSNEDLWVKRVIGLPGETVSYKEDHLYINGKLVEEPFLDESYCEKIRKERNLLYFSKDYEGVKLKKDEYLLVGDNRVDSLDSRSDTVGPFQREQIIAKGMFVFQPVSEMRYIGNGR